MREWFSKDNVPIYPKVRRAKLGEIPLPTFGQHKYDGELTWLILKAGKCYTVNKWGRFRSDYPITDFALNNFISDGVFVGELYIPQGNLYDFLRNRDNIGKLRLAIFDVQIPKAYYERYEHLLRVGLTQDDSEPIHIAYGKLLKTKEELSQFYTNALKQGFEGIVCRHPDQKWEEPALKVKRLETADVIVIGIAKDSKLFKLDHTKRMVGSLLIGAYQNGKLITLGRVGSGFTMAQRRALYEALMETKTNEDERYIYVTPRLVIEISYQEIIPSKEYPTGWTLRHPTFRKFKFDSNPKQVKLEHEFTNH